jgi:hypothetical protein
MSDTPRTDAAVTVTIGRGFNTVCPNFARQLERENAELKNAIELGQENCDAEYESLREERDEARADLASLRVSYEQNAHQCVELNRDLARVTAERDDLSRVAAERLELHTASRRRAEQAEQRNAELEARLAAYGKYAACEETTTSASLIAKCCDLEQCVAELVAAIQEAINYAGGRETEWGDRAVSAFNILEQALARAESATPAKCEKCGGSGLVRHLGRDNDEIVADCPDCCATPAKHPDTVRLDWLERDEIGAARRCLAYNDIRAAIDAAMKEASK